MTRNQISFAELQEKKRYNKAQEGLASDTLTETQRSNRAREAETHRSNLANEYELRRAHLINEAEAERSHRANERIGYMNNYVDQQRLQETQRANLAQEELTGNRDLSTKQAAYMNAANASKRTEAQNQVDTARANLYQKQADNYEMSKFFEGLKSGTGSINDIIRGGKMIWDALVN